MPEEGTETLVWGTSSAGLVTEVSAEATESPSGGNVEIEKGVPDLESGPRSRSGVADDLFYATWYAVGTMSLTFLDMSSEQRSAAAPLEPSLEALLREVNCHEEILMAFRVQEIVDRGLFVALDSTEEGIRKTAQEAFGIDPEKGGLHTNENWPR